MDVRTGLRILSCAGAVALALTAAAKEEWVELFGEVSGTDVTWTEDSFGRFELTCEFQRAEPAGGAILIYGCDKEKPDENSVRIPLPEKTPAGKWNRLRLLADGANVSLAANGGAAKACDLSGKTNVPHIGWIGLQGGATAGSVRFRNARVRPLPAIPHRGPFTLMSYNIQVGYGYHDPWPKHLPKGSQGHLPQVAANIVAQKPDFVGLQEVDRFGERSGGLDQSLLLSRLTGMDYVWIDKLPSYRTYGISALFRDIPFRVTRTPMKGHYHVRLLLTAEYPNYIVANSHFPLDDANLTNAARIVKATLLNRGKPTFLMGDLNARPDHAAIRSLLEDFAPLNDLETFTFPSRKSSSCIDYIMVDRAHADRFRVVRRDVVPDGEASDHSAVVVTIDSAKSGR